MDKIGQALYRLAKWYNVYHLVRKSLSRLYPPQLCDVFFDCRFKMIGDLRVPKELIKLLVSLDVEWNEILKENSCKYNVLATKQNYYEVKKIPLRQREIINQILR